MCKIIGYWVGGECGGFICSLNGVHIVLHLPSTDTEAQIRCLVTIVSRLEFVNTTTREHGDIANDEAETSGNARTHDMVATSYWRSEYLSEYSFTNLATRYFPHGEASCLKKREERKGWVYFFLFRSR